MSKVIFESNPQDNKTQEKQIETQFKLLNFLKDGHAIEYDINETGWYTKDSTYFSVGEVAYRVLEKKKTVTVYTMICINSNGQIYSWGTENKNLFDTEVNNLDRVGYKLLKTHVDTLEI